MTENNPIVLVIEDEAPIRRFLKVSLVNHNFVFKEAFNGKDGLLQAASLNPDLVILDLGLPDMDGLEVTKQIREWSTVPIIILSAREQEGDKVEALDAGADDYLTKPFGVAELLARIRVALRHTSRIAQDKTNSFFLFGAVKIDFAKREVLFKEQEIHLTPNEYKLLVMLIRHAGKVVTHNQLLKEIWGHGYSEETHYLRVYMAQLRKKLEEDPAHPRYFITEPGVGYRLKIEN